MNHTIFIRKTMRLCKDCKHYQGPTSPDECTAPQNMKDEPDYVNGATEPTYKWATAQSCRIHAQSGCGPDAKWFEPKPYVKAIGGAGGTGDYEK